MTCFQRHIQPINTCVKSMEDANVNTETINVANNMIHKLTNQNKDPAIIIDIEASGFGVGSYPIEVGLAFPDGGAQCYLIKPEKEWTHWDKEAEAVHGIKKETLTEYGTDARTVAQHLNSLLRGKTVYCDGWSKDLSWLATLFESVDNTPLFRIETLTKILSQSQLNNWEKIKAKVIQELELTRHRASADALILQHTYQRSFEI